MRELCVSALVLLLCTVIFCAGFVSSCLYFNTHRFILKDDIVASAPKSWDKNSFNCNGHLMEDTQGRKHFIAAKEIDDWIKRINKLLEDK